MPPSVELIRSWPKVAPLACALIAAVTGMDVADPVLVTLTTSAETVVSSRTSMPEVNEAPPEATIRAVSPIATPPAWLTVPAGAYVPSVQYHSQPLHRNVVPPSTLTKDRMVLHLGQGRVMAAGTPTDIALPPSCSARPRRDRPGPGRTA